MSLRATLWALDEAEVDNPTSVLVLVALADECDDAGGSCYPSLRRIAHRARVSVNTARNHIGKLETAGLIEVIKPTRQGRGQHNEYRLLIERSPQNLDPSCSEETRGKGQDPVDKRAERVKPEPRLPVDPNTPVDPKENTLLADLPSSINLKPVDEFEAWWKQYPRKTAKAAARKAWPKAREQATARQLTDGLASIDPKQPKYIPHPATWLNGERWKDEPTKPGQQIAASIKIGRITEL